MFHLKDNLYFGRLADGSVRIVKFRAVPMAIPQADQVFAAADVLMDVAMEELQWASVVLAVSAKPEDAFRMAGAVRFHNGEE
jgi:hypothetical protein